MTTSRMNPKVDFYFNKAEKWREELAKLRRSLLHVSEKQHSSNTCI
jgi:uncharacterized protein YdeI (YjbR/CyaY-like superfamily)